jgi:hypothetical protein
MKSTQKGMQENNNDEMLSPKEIHALLFATTRIPLPDKLEVSPSGSPNIEFYDILKKSHLIISFLECLTNAFQV